MLWTCSPSQRGFLRKLPSPALQSLSCEPWDFELFVAPRIFVGINWVEHGGALLYMVYAFSCLALSQGNFVSETHILFQ